MHHHVDDGGQSLSDELSAVPNPGRSVDSFIVVMGCESDPLAEFASEASLDKGARETPEIDPAAPRTFAHPSRLNSSTVRGGLLSPPTEAFARSEVHAAEVQVPDELVRVRRPRSLTQISFTISAVVAAMVLVGVTIFLSSVPSFLSSVPRNERVGTTETGESSSDPRPSTRTVGSQQDRPSYVAGPPETAAADTIPLENTTPDVSREPAALGDTHGRIERTVSSEPELDLPGGDAPRDAPPVSSASPVQHDSASLPSGASTQATEPIPIIRPADVGNATAYSPSFGASGSSIFFHAGRGASTSLLKASLSGDGSLVGVTTIVRDGASNYHVQLSPDESRIAFDSDRDGERGVYVADLDGSHARRVSGLGYAAIPSWSPDGARLAFVRAEPARPNVWNVWTAELATNDLQRLTSHRVGQRWGGSWFPDSRRLAYSHEDRLIILDTHTKGVERVFPSPVQRRLVRTPAVAPDGRRIVFQVYRDGTWVLDVTDGSMRRISNDSSAEEFAWAPNGSVITYHSRRSGEWSIWMARP